MIRFVIFNYFFILFLAWGGIWMWFGFGVLTFTYSNKGNSEDFYHCIFKN